MQAPVKPCLASQLLPLLPDQAMWPCKELCAILLGTMSNKLLSVTLAFPCGHSIAS